MFASSQPKDCEKDGNTGHTTCNFQNARTFSTHCSTQRSPQSTLAYSYRQTCDILHSTQVNISAATNEGIREKWQAVQNGEAPLTRKLFSTAQTEVLYVLRMFVCTITHHRRHSRQCLCSLPTRVMRRDRSHKMLQLRSQIWEKSVETKGGR